VSLDLVAGRERQVAREVPDHAIIHVLNGSAGDANQVMMMTAPGQPIVKATVLQKHPTDDAHLAQKLHSAKDGGPAYLGNLTQDIVNSEVIPAAEDRRQYRQAGGRHPIVMGFQAPNDSVQLRHLDTEYQ
jgi:hypothetical protein